MNGEGGLWRLRALAVVLAVVLWFAVSVEKREPLAERSLTVNVSYNPPAGTIILDPIETVRVRLRGKAGTIRGMDPDAVDALVEIASSQIGNREILLRAEQLFVPEGVEVLSIDPNPLRLTLDLEVSGRLPIRVRLNGEPAAGAIAGRPEAIPPEAVVHGPASRIRGVGPVTTTPIDLSGHALAFEERAALISPDPLIQIVDPLAVTVRVPLAVPPAPVP